MLQMASRFHISAHFPGVKPSVFRKKKGLFVLVVCIDHTGAIAAFTVNNICPFKYRTRESGREKVKIYTSRGEKLKRKKELISHKIAKAWSSYYDLFTESKKNTF